MCRALGHLYLYTYTYTARSGVFSSSLESNRMTLLGAEVAYLYYTPVLRSPLSNCQKFSFKKEDLLECRTCLEKKPFYRNTCLLVGQRMVVRFFRIGWNRSFVLNYGVVGFKPVAARLGWNLNNHARLGWWMVGWTPWFRILVSFFFFPLFRFDGRGIIKN